MISLDLIRARYKRGTHSKFITEESAKYFVSMIENGMSLDSVIEIMSGLNSTHSDSTLDAVKRQDVIAKLARSETVRRSALFCALLGVKQIVLAGFNDVKFERMKDAKIWLELKGYSRLTKSQYRDCIQAWIKKESVAKVQSLPSGKFLVQEFKIV